jgi:hypothetical protein
MLICKECWEKEEAKLEKEHDTTWETAQHTYEQCELCLRSCLCAEV